MPSVDVNTPFTDRKTISQLEDDILNHIIEGIIKIKDEAGSYVTGTLIYSLDNTIYNASSTTVSIKGTHSSSQLTFTYGTDYTVSSNTVTWDANERVPDNNTTFYVTYQYKGTKSGLTDRNVGSVTRIIVDAIISVLHDTHDDLQDSYYNAFVESATDTALDNLGTLVGCKRVAPKEATGNAWLNFTRTATVADPIYVPTGSVFSTTKTTTTEALKFESQNDTGVTYVGYQFTSSDSGEVLIQASATGTTYNVGVDTISVVESALTDISYVSNPSAVAGATDNESDTSYRKRIPLELDKKGKATESAVEAAVLAVDGVKLVSLRDRNRGPGTVDIFIVPDSRPMGGTVSGDTVTVINSTRSAGINYKILEPTYVELDVGMYLTYKTNSTTGTIFDDVDAAVGSYLTGVSVGGTAYYSQLLSDIINCNSDIVDVTGMTMASSGESIQVNTDEIVDTGTTTILFTEES